MKLVRFLQIAVILALLASLAPVAQAEYKDPLSASFSTDVTSGGAPLTVHFIDHSSGAPIEWHWNFGDETYSDTQDPTHTFSTPGAYNVTLTVSDGADSSTASLTITVTTAPTATPTPANPIYIVVPVKPGHPGKPVVDKPVQPVPHKPDTPKKPDQPKNGKPVKKPDSGKKKPVRDEWKVQ